MKNDSRFNMNGFEWPDCDGQWFINDVMLHLFNNSVMLCYVFFLKAQRTKNRVETN